MLLSVTPHITSIVADNRGWVIMTADTALKSTTLTSSSIQIYTAGTDKVLGTADDNKKSVGIFYNAAEHKITLKSTLPADTRYRIRLVGNLIQGSDGTKLDGEFNGQSVKSGNGTPGGNYDAVTKVRSDPVARFTTDSGVMHVTLFKTQVATTVANFKLYADNAIWDNTFFHRKTTLGADGIAVMQGGGFGVTGANKVKLLAQANAIPLQAGISNLAYTISMARQSGDATGTNQWFFNYSNNTVLNPAGTNHGYAVFGQIASSMHNVLDALAARAIVNASGAQNTSVVDDGGDAQVNSYVRSNMATLPVKSATAFAARGNVLSPNSDLLKVQRVALLMNVTSTALEAKPPSAAVVVAAPAATFSQTPVATSDVLASKDAVLK